MKNTYDIEKFLGDGWHPVESDGHKKWSWSKAGASLNFPVDHKGYSISLSSGSVISYEVSLFNRDHKIHASSLGSALSSFNILPGVRRCVIRLSDTWIPKEVLGTFDKRSLGICLHSINNLDFYSRTCAWYPEVVEIGLVGICNINPPCVMCVTRNSRDNIKYPFLSENILEKMLPCFDKAKFVTLHGTEGEPLLSPVLFTVLNKINNKKVHTLFASNGLLLTRESSVRLISAGLGSIEFSLDAASSLTYRKIRNNDGFFTVKNNIKQLVALKKEYNSFFPDIIINTVLMKENLNELNDFIELAYELEIKKVRIRFMVPLAKNYEVNTEVFHFNYYEQRIDPNDYAFKAVVRQAKKKAKQLGIELFSDNPEVISLLMEEKNKDFGKRIYNYQMRIDFEGESISDMASIRQNILCRYPWKNVIIDLDGSVRFCCHSKEVLGNLHESEFLEIWNGKIACSIRDSFLRQRFPSNCLACPLCLTQGQAWSSYVSR